MEELEKYDNEKDLLYGIKMGFYDLDKIPEYERTLEICEEACKRNPMNYDYVPADVREQMKENREVFLQIQERYRRQQQKYHKRDNKKKEQERDSIE